MFWVSEESCMRDDRDPRRKGKGQGYKGNVNVSGNELVCGIQFHLLTF